ncbi:hypothetical protein [Yinghuangia soli]|uniref:Uncharacterized protein n=1 Tax=Yinghuangia soli TaxID=2908204 RepID=A0AA41U1K7_9ACTN|nr:hypothetical protein [Yinghuangia soli]MCF2529741.1 hypothetical protein [Yinghuangia soli]
MAEQMRTPAPEIGSIVDTIYGRRRVMDIMTPADHEHPMVFFRPVEGGREGCVALSEWPKVVRP